jgi:hypothetical protein
MSQHDYNIANQGFSSFRSDLNNALSAIQTTNSGTSRPTGAVAGQLWLDTTSATTPTLKYYDGADDISLATIDHTANTVNWLDSTVSITGLSTTATGTVLTLSDSATTSTVNLIIDNDKEIRFREATANGTNYVSLSAPASLSADLTFTLPATDGTNGQALITNGSGVLSFTTISAGTSWQSVKTSGFTAVAGEGYPCNTTSSAFTVTLPASPSVGSYIQIVDYAGTFATNNLTLGANGNKINGGTGNKGLTTNREAVTVTYVDSTQGWVSTSGANEGTISLDTLPYAIDFLVVAGGGGSGGGSPANSGGSGGGGAGGMRTSTQTVSSGVAITVTVGDGGAGSPSITPVASSGSSSSISGSGLTTITSAGGGYGSSQTNPSGTSGANGGAGGGTGWTGSVASSGNTPSTSPSQGANGGIPSAQTGGGGGGGGGSSGVTGGNSVATNSGGSGGNGTTSSITGTSTYYAGGGGGGGQGGGGGSGGTGGLGGGGTGTASSSTGASGTANLGGGGGGTGTGAGGSGGKGVVILSVPTASYSGTSTGSPTVTTSGSNTILKFTGSGSYTT